MQNDNLTLIYIFWIISLNNCPIWKIKKLGYSGEQALHPKRVPHKYLRVSAAKGLRRVIVIYWSYSMFKSIIPSQIHPTSVILSIVGLLCHFECKPIQESRPFFHENWVFICPSARRACRMEGIGKIQFSFYYWNTTGEQSCNLKRHGQKVWALYAKGWTLSFLHRNQVELEWEFEIMADRQTTKHVIFWKTGPI